MSLVFGTRSLFFYSGFAVDTECFRSGKTKEKKNDVFTLEIFGCRRDVKAQISKFPRPLDVF